VHLLFWVITLWIKLQLSNLIFTSAKFCCNSFSVLTRINDISNLMLCRRDLGLLLYMQYHAMFFYIKYFISMLLITDQQIF